jgi:hypothetical protein
MRDYSHDEEVEEWCKKSIESTQEEKVVGFGCRASEQRAAIEVGIRAWNPMAATPLRVISDALICLGQSIGTGNCIERRIEF